MFLSLLRNAALKGAPRRALVGVCVVGVVTNLLMLAVPLYSLQIFDRVLSSRSMDTLWLLSIAVLIALGTLAVLEIVRARILVRIANRYALEMEPRVLDASLTQAALGGGRRAEPLRDVATVRNFLGTGRGLVALLDAPMSPVFIAFVALLNPMLGLATLVGALLLFGLTIATEVLTAPSVRAAGDSAQRAQGRADAALANAEAIEAMGMRHAMLSYWHAAQSRSLGLTSEASDRASVLASAARLARMVLSMAMTALGAYFAITDQLTIGGMVAATMLAARALAPMEILIGAWRQFVQARASLERLNTLFARFTRDESAMQLPVPTGAVLLEGVVYAPTGREPTLRGVSLAIPAGSMVGLIGPSGAGKSTLAKLMCGVWPAKSGAVRLDGADVYRWNRRDFGRHVGYLPQDVELFAGSVRDNIARFSAEATDEQVVAAAQLAGVHDMILRLPEGYATEIGPGGAALSGGLRQRVALARALFGEPKLVVLDEPNASLDTEGEQALIEALAAVKARGATLVVITHRPSILAAADLLAVLIAGRLERSGPARELIGLLAPGAAKVKLVREGPGQEGGGRG